MQHFVLNNCLILQLLMKHILAIILSMQYFFIAAQTQLHKPFAKKITSLSFTTLTGGTIILKAQFDHFLDTLNFVFDTGSGGISLDSTTAEDLKLITQESEKMIKGIAGIRKLKFLYKHSLKLKGLTVDSLDFHINNYNIISSAYGIKVDGVIGLSFLRKFIINVNYDNNIMDIYEPHFIQYPKRGYLLKPNFNSLPTFTSNIIDNINSTGDLIFDTGAGLNVLLTDRYVNDSCLLKPKRTIFTTQAEGLGGKKVMQTSVVSKVFIGPYKFKLVPVYIFKDEFNVINYPHNVGIMGNDILRRFNLIINYPNQEIHLKPNTHFFDDFDYSYTGLGLYQVGDIIKIEDIVAGSPADKAGLKPDDIVFAVDNNFTKNMQAYKIALQNAGSSVQILVLRNGQPIAITLKIINILN
jgi:PDZ domain/Aspartyl protease